MERKSVQTLVYEELKKNIMSMRLKPGQAMSTQEMATKLNVSRTPVREAFLQLQSEGLVEMIPQRETIVSRIDLKRVNQEKFIRECLELGVVNRFLDKKEQKDIQAMLQLIDVQKQCAQTGDCVGFLDADDRFHKILFDATDQQMAWATIISRNGHYNRLRILFVQEKAVMESSVGQHAEIVELLEAGEKERIRRALVSHIQRLEVDKTGLVMLYPDYFDTEGRDNRERRIGTL
ncbi:MAG: GntR family transcriptional regulator [Enterocloster sp.]